MMTFDKPGIENTQIALEKAKEVALEKGISHVVVASTFGNTGLMAAQLFHGCGINLVVVTHNTGFKKEGEQELDLEKKEEMERLGAKVYIGTMVLRSLGAAIRDRTGFSHQQLVADTLRMFGQGVKVCVEIVAMACDAGLIPFGDVIAVAGTGRGADTALILKANSSNRFFDIKIKEVIVKPRDF